MLAAWLPVAARRAAIVNGGRSDLKRRQRAERMAARERKERWQLRIMIGLLMLVLVTFFVYSSLRYLSRIDRLHDKHPRRHHHNTVDLTSTNVIP